VPEPNPQPGPQPTPQPAPQPGPTPEAPDRGPEGVFRANLEAFGDRAAKLCRLARTGRISPDSCFVALTQLWIQLARAHRRLADRAEPQSHVQNEDRVRSTD
jgi:hypothetical protein